MISEGMKNNSTITSLNLSGVNKNKETQRRGKGNEQNKRNKADKQREKEERKQKKRKERKKIEKE